MYLAEDRIMCLEILTRKDSNWILNYIPNCKAITDPPTGSLQLIKQRRRWTNGSMFAGFHVLRHCCKVWRRKNSCMRNFFLIPMFMYMFLQTCITFVLVGIFYGTFSSIVRSQFTPSEDGNTKCISTEMAAVLENIFILMLAITFVFSTMVDIRESETGFKLLILGFGLL